MKTSSKFECRFLLKQKRKEISEKRRLEASFLLVYRLLPLLSKYKKILSFSSFGGEIDTSLLNHFLCLEGKLHLPKIERNRLEIFFVDHLTDLIPNHLGINEPSNSEGAFLYEMEVILVPGLGFDPNLHRIGYGKGYYDRLLSSAPHARKIGIGFKEQLVSSLPIEKTDQNLSELFLV